jgi:UDP-N-acetylmuramoyl-tripeptide--D-alanyl-D-alanine ligase
LIFSKLLDILSRPNMSLFTRNNTAALRWCGRQFIYVLAYLWRRLLFRTTFIAITGSLGKTTTKECIAAILSAHFSTAKTLRNQNDRSGILRTIFRVRPWHRFAIVEVGTDRPGSMERYARLLRPHVAVVLTVAGTHTRNFSTLDQAAAEKAKIVEALPGRGLAILNAEDPRVRKMAASCRCRVKTFGVLPTNDFWADEVSSAWPSRLKMRVHADGETHAVQTNLVGEHWANSVLAALLTASCCGIDLKAAISAVEQVQPFYGRMQPVLLPGGAVMIRDEYNCAFATLEAALRAFAKFQAARRVLVVSGFSDSSKNSVARFRELGKMASEVGDLAIFISKHHGHHAVKAAIAAGMKPGCALSFADLVEAANYLKSELRGGDLVLLKGRMTDHLSRLFFAQFGAISCWKTDCSKRIMCDYCPELGPEFEMQADGMR